LNNKSNNERFRTENNNNKFSIINEEDKNNSENKTLKDDKEKAKDKKYFQHIINKTFICIKNYFINNNSDKIKNENNNNKENKLINNRETVKTVNIYDVQFETLKKEYEKIIEKKFNSAKKEKFLMV